MPPRRLRVVFDNNVVNLSNTAIDMLNDTAAAIQEGFAGRPQQRTIREQVPVAQGIRKLASVIASHHIRHLLRDHIPDLEEEYDTISRKIDRVTLAVCHDLALAGDEQAARAWRNVTTDHRRRRAPVSQTEEGHDQDEEQDAG
ncbi:hypothetical protein MAM1_0097d05127 [Mucor ambiguus]|uniref:Uncharacterized protein n=1 Tax=Mucor ambiguus TaxID=91626 RepID=A0A0C9ME66_9FUNG|nr:hypothetical protein MAM1_0097d05127 [Mucor ambiguus]